MSDPGYRIVSARYANPEHTCVVVQTAQAGAVAASRKDRPSLWARIHACGVPIQDYDPAFWSPSAVPMAPQSAPETELLSAPQEIPPVVPIFYQEPVPAPAPALPPPLPPAPAQAHDWRTATAAVLDDPEWDARERRRAAREAVQVAAAEANRLTTEDQLLHELALMVVNENVEAMNDMKAAAAAAGLPVKEYAKRTIAIHHARRRRAGYIEAVKVQALKEIDAAAGDIIEAVANRAVAAIAGEE